MIKAMYLLIRAFLALRLSPAAENLARRQQVAVYKHSVKRLKLRPRDRVFWVGLSRLWSHWRSALAIVHSDTVSIRIEGLATPRRVRRALWAAASVFLAAPGDNGLSVAARELVTVAETEEYEGRRQSWAAIIEGELGRA
jgi:hypothetical protein